MIRLMDDTKQEISRLRNRICILENENRLLKEKLTEAGISYEDIAEASDNADMLYDPDQGARIRKIDVTDKAANNFFMMFCRGRKDVYELRKRGQRISVRPHQISFYSKRPATEAYDIKMR